jgi:diguanylate cyclase (GGDEF)-like protein
MDLYLTPASISFIAQTILFLGISIYLVVVNNHTNANYWLSGFFTIMVAASLAGFVGVSSLGWYEYAFHLHTALVVLALALLIQFAYNFPDANPAFKKEARIVLWVSVILSLIALTSSIFHSLWFEFFAQISIVPIIIQSVQVIELAWVIVLLLKLTIRNGMSSTKEKWWSHFIHPQGRSARARRGFTLSLFGMLIFWIISLVLTILNQISVSIFIYTLSTTWALAIIIITLTNHTNRRGSFLIKLIEIILLTTFTGISTAAWISAPASYANFQASSAIPNRQTIHFTQNNATYSITQQEFRFESQLGRQLVFAENENTTKVDLLVNFPYAGENWQQLLVSQKGFILFPQTPQNTNRLTLPQNANPVIAALYLQDLQPTTNGGVFAHLTEEKSIFTWYLMPLQDNPDTSITTQLVLYPDGSFDIIYNGIQTNFQYSPYIPKQLQQVSGFFLGSNDVSPIRTQFNNQLPLTSLSWSGVYQDYYIDFRSYLHKNMLMQLIAMIITSLVMVIVFPIFFQNSLSTPLKTIRSGIMQVIQGDTKTWLEPRYSDELGQTVYELNKMINFLDLQKEKDQAITVEMEEKLIRRTGELKQSIEKLAHEIELRKRLSEQLEKCVNQVRKLATTDDLLGCFNRVHIVSVLEEEIKRSRRYNSPLSVVTIDPDYLRMINETYGTLTGDEVLKSLAQTIQNTLRETDTMGRIGGEEFAIIMPQNTGAEALIGANRIRNIIGSQLMETSKGPIRISASMGVVEMPTEGMVSVDLLLQRADQALEEAKRLGRNQAILWTQTLDKAAE